MVYFHAPPSSLWGICAWHDAPVSARAWEATVGLMEILSVVIVFTLGAAAGAAVTLWLNLLSLVIPIGLLVLIVVNVLLAKWEHDRTETSVPTPVVPHSDSEVPLGPELAF